MPRPPVSRRPTRRHPYASARRRPPRSTSTSSVVAAVLAGALLVGAIVFLAASGRSSGPPRPRYAAPSRGAPAVERPAVGGDVGRVAAGLHARRVSDRAAAARRLAEMGPQAVPAIPALLDAMGQRSLGIEVEVSIRKAFKAMGRAAVPGLQDALRSPDGRTRHCAAQALMHVGPPASGAVPDLIGVLESDPDLTVRASAAAALGAIGPPASPAIPALKRAAGNPNAPITHDTAIGQLRVRARMALDRIQSPTPR